MRRSSMGERSEQSWRGYYLRLRQTRERFLRSEVLDWHFRNSFFLPFPCQQMRRLAVKIERKLMDAGSFRPSRTDSRAFTSAMRWAASQWSDMIRGDGWLITNALREEHFRFRRAQRNDISFGTVAGRARRYGHINIPVDFQNGR